MKFGLLLAFAISAAAQTANIRDHAMIDDLVVANHILANEGILDGYGHISMRDPANPKHFLTVRGVGYRFVG